MISIIVPIYNVEKYLPRCIESLVSQSYKDIEIILVDDGSPDDCPQICDDYAKKDNRIIVIHQKNRGVSAARNAGLDIARGEYIGFVDPDDWVTFDMYEKLLCSLVNEKADMAICGYDYCDEEGYVDISRKYTTKSTEVITQKDVLSRLADILPTIRNVVWNKLFVRKTVGDLRFIDRLKVSEDVLFLDEYVKKISQAVIVHQALYMNTVREGSATHGGVAINNLVESLKVHSTMYEDTISMYPDLKRHAQAFLLDVSLLRYNESKRIYEDLPASSQMPMKSQLRYMREHIRRNSLKAIFNAEIYWKTRVFYLIVR